MSGMALSKKETRKVVQTGNSLGVGLPKSIIDSLKIKRGDEIEFDVKDNQIILNKKRKWEEEVDTEMLEMLSETFEEHDEVFKNLKDR
ncbi:AbrB/MazE/SpoVT family DNA-binding domain-containing protein [Halobacillus sp. A5]|uniref:AbrB/MazE/SpoVT family DNA-binding domain-containing protein n=1 Tax=Halobacillus sp. A5 TaxID=2880263 RepID=UPI0020A6C4D1|nr:AbrB/MazE/SpoVT family DNA-binding domain-containing protein [Halobacillus sp. A5]MCP3029620.1 AbrB/MazE/SpoVT family DNA-binding domain-containing protein [Halobacillus sp. A5]